jgi:hypothetical protein
MHPWILLLLRRCAEKFARVELFRHRKKQAGELENEMKIEKSLSCQGGESSRAWLRKHL